MFQIGRVDDHEAVAPDSNVAADFASMGLDLRPEAVSRDDAFQIWPENWNSLHAWLACETQWRVLTGSGGRDYQGLDYTAVDVVMRRLGLEDQVFSDLQEMERAALATFAESSR